MKCSSFFLLLICFQLLARAQNIPSFKPLRYDENYGALKNDTGSHWYSPIKYTPLSKNNNSYISLGGDIRYQYSWYKNQNWGETPDDKDGFILTRYLAHADFHAGNHFRTFVQIQSSFANGKEETPPPIEENPLDLHQAFFDLAVGKQNELIVRTGRQELLYGSQRLVSVREGPNNRLAFDAFKILYVHKTFITDIFYSHPVLPKQHIFDDGFNKSTTFWGAYFVKNKSPILKNLDLYYFGLWKNKTTYDDGTGEELRHTVGSRTWNSFDNFRYDIEGCYQFGSFADKDIAAWTFSINAGYKFRNVRLKPEFGLKTEFISGDAAYEDNKLQTLNPLFPRGGYFGLVSIIGPSNLIDIHPSLVIEFSPKVFFNIDYDVFWRYSTNDGIYSPGTFLIYSGKNNPQRFIGKQLSTDLAYTPNNFLSFRTELTWFDAGAYLKAAGPGKDILYAALTTQLKF